MYQFNFVPIDDVRNQVTRVFSEQGKALSCVTIRHNRYLPLLIDTCCTREIIRDTLQREMLADIARDIRNRDKWHAIVAGIPGYMNDVREQLETALSQHAEGALK